MGVPKLSAEVETVADALELVAQYKSWLEDAGDTRPHPGHNSMADAALKLAEEVVRLRERFTATLESLYEAHDAIHQATVDADHGLDPDCDSDGSPPDVDDETAGGGGDVVKTIEVPEWAEGKVRAYLTELCRERDAASNKMRLRELVDYELCQMPGCSNPTDKYTSPQVRCVSCWRLYID